MSNNIYCCLNFETLPKEIISTYTDKANYSSVKIVRTVVETELYYTKSSNHETPDQSTQKHKTKTNVNSRLYTSTNRPRFRAEGKTQKL